MYRYVTCTSYNVDELHRLVESSNPSDRAKAASDPALSEEDMLKLAQDDDMYVRLWLARNENIPSEILDTLARYELELSGDDYYYETVQSIVDNSNIYVDTLYYMCRRYIALCKQGKQSDLLGISIASSPEATPEILNAIYRESPDDEQIAYYVATNPNVSRELLQRIRDEWSTDNDDDFSFIDKNITRRPETIKRNLRRKLRS